MNVSVIIFLFTEFPRSLHLFVFDVVYLVFVTMYKQN